MAKRTFLLFILTFTTICTLFGQAAPGMAADTAQQKEDSHLRISLLTCGPGEEVWETFGHACLRVIDSSKTGAEHDVIYNYGFFETSEDNPIWKQVFSGRVLDLLDTITYSELMDEYIFKKRSIDEQVLLLSPAQGQQVLAFLKNNLKKHNRYYEFDTFYDNCSTRIVDLFRKLFGSAFVTPPVLPQGSRLTFRDVSITRLCPQQYKYWFGFGLNLTYASRADKVMNDTEALYLPVFLSKGFAGATLNGRLLCASKTSILPETITWHQSINEPFICLLLLSVVTIGALLYSRRPVWGKIMSAIVLLLTGLLGLGVLYLWTMDGEPAFKDNYIILWALPTNILLPFLPRLIKMWYSIFAMALIGIAMLLHILRIQYLPLQEITPLLLALLWIYSDMYRKLRIVQRTRP